MNSITQDMRFRLSLVKSFERVMRSLSMFHDKKSRKRRANKPHHTPTTPGEMIQIDVKYVPKQPL